MTVIEDNLQDLAPGSGSLREETGIPAERNLNVVSQTLLKYHPDFTTSSSCDVVLQASDDTCFRVPRELLTANSSVFVDLFSTVESHHNAEDNIIPLTSATSGGVKLLLQFLQRGFNTDDVSNVEDRASAIRLAQTFEFEMFVPETFLAYLDAAQVFHVFTVAALVRKPDSASKAARLAILDTASQMPRALRSILVEQSWDYLYRFEDFRFSVDMILSVFVKEINYLQGDSNAYCDFVKRCKRGDRNWGDLASVTFSQRVTS